MASAVLQRRIRNILEEIEDVIGHIDDEDLSAQLTEISELLVEVEEQLAG